MWQHAAVFAICKQVSHDCCWIRRWTAHGWGILILYRQRGFYLLRHIHVVSSRRFVKQVHGVKLIGKCVCLLTIHTENYFLTEQWMSHCLILRTGYFSKILLAYWLYFKNKLISCVFVLLQCFELLVGWWEGHPACKKLDVGLLIVMIWLGLCTSYNSNCHHRLRHR